MKYKSLLMIEFILIGYHASVQALPNRQELKAAYRSIDADMDKLSPEEQDKVIRDSGVEIFAKTGAMSGGFGGYFYAVDKWPSFTNKNIAKKLISRGFCTGAGAWIGLLIGTAMGTIRNKDRFFSVLDKAVDEKNRKQ